MSTSTRADKLEKAILVLEQYSLSLNEAKPSTFGRKKSSSLEKEKQACQDIREVLTSWELSHLQKIEFSRAISLLFQCLDHKESAIRILADQALDAILRRFQIKFQPQRVINILLTELSKKSSARCLCGAFNKLALTIHLYRSHKAGIYSLHFMNSVCIALPRPEESIQLAIEKTFPTIFSKVGRFVGVSHVEKAEELFQTALLNLDLSGAANRSACVVIANLAKFVPSILHKSFYKLSSIIFEPDEVEHKARLAGAINAFRLMWEPVVSSLAEFSLNILQKLLCKVLCCLYSTSTEVVVAALELLECAVANTKPSIMEFSPFLAESNQCSNVLNSPFHSNQMQQQEQQQQDHRLDIEEEFLGMEELESVISRSPWTSMNDVSEAFGSDILSGRESSMLDFPQSSNASQTTDEPPDYLDGDSFSAGAEILADPLLNCDNYMSLAEEMMGAGSSSSSRNDCITPPVSSHFGKSSTGAVSEDGLAGIPEFLPDDFCPRNVNFYVYSSLTIAKRFLLAGLGKGLKEDKDIRISQKILAFSFLLAAVQKHPSIVKEAVHGYDGDQFLSDIYGFLDHDDDGLVIAVLNFFVNAEKSYLSKGKTPHSGKTLSMIAKTLQSRNPLRLKGAFQVFANCVSMLVLDEQMLCTACDLAISTFNVDYFLVKIARADFLAKIEWSKASTHSRAFYQPKCLEVLLKQVFDSDARVVKATCDVFFLVVKNAEFDQHRTTLFYTSVPDWFADSGLALIPMIHGLHPSKYSFRGYSTELLLEHSLTRIIQDLYHLSIDNLSQNQPGFLQLLSVLAQHFPPCLYAQAWITFSGISKLANNLTGLLLEIAESSCSSLAELTALFRLISSLFAGISENSLLRGANKKGQQFQQTLLFGVGDSQVLESIIILCLRVLNLYYTIIAEEKTKDSSALTASIFSRPNLISPLTPKLGDVLKSTDTPSTPPTSSRTTNLSFLVGTSVKMTRNTSYLQSNYLKHLEPAVKGAYRNFLDTINTESHRRFVEPMEASMSALCAVLEMASFALARSFQEEFLLYLKILFDVSVQHSASLIHLFLKAIFSKNGININSALVQSIKTSNEPFTDSNLLNVYLQQSINQFTVFSAFINKPEYMENYLARNAGWMAGNTLNKSGLLSEAQLKEIGTSLQMFERFITRLIHIYALTNSTGIRTAILEVLTCLSLNDVRYEMVDANKKFYHRILNQIKQLQREDVPLLQPIFFFLVVLARVNYHSFGDVENLMAELFMKVDENNILQVLDAIHAVLLETINHRKTVNIKPTKIKHFLCKEFDFLFSHCATAAAHLWILLLNSAKSSKDEEYWSEVSFDFFVLFTKWCLKKNSINSRLEAPVHTQFSVLLSYCSPSVFRPIDQFYNCMEGILQLPFLPTSPFIGRSISTESVKISAFQKVLPFFFHLLCRMDENVVLLRLNTLNKDSVDFLGKSMASLIFECTKSLRTQNTNINLIEEELVFFILVFLHATRSGKAPCLMRSFKDHLFCILETESRISHRSNLHLVIELGQTHVKTHAYWFALLLTLDYSSEQRVELYFSENYSSHTKTLATILLVHKICGQSDARFANIFDNATEEFCVRLLKLNDYFKEALFNKFISQVPNNVLESILTKQYHFLHTNHLDTLVPAFIKYLNYFNTNINSPNKLNQTDSWETKLDLLNQWVCNKFKVESVNQISLQNYRGFKLNVEFSSTLTNFEFYALLAEKSEKEEDFYKICCILQLFDSLEILAIIRKISAKHNLCFFRVLFHWLQSETRAAIGTAHLKDLQFSGQNGLASSCQAVVDAIFIMLATPQAMGCAEYVFVLARLSELNPEFFAVQEETIGECVERLINEVFLECLMTRKLEKKSLPTDFFKALKYLFNWKVVFRAYEKDYYLLENLRQFISVLWDEVLSKGLHKWDRQALEKGKQLVKNVKVDTETASAEMELRKEGVLQLFLVVQRIVYAFRNNLVQQKEVALALKTLLRLPLLFRMTLVPENALKLDWNLTISCRKDQIWVPLVNIHMLGEVDILQDFVWRILWLGWTCKNQFEECWMSLFGVLSSTPTGALELASTANQNVFQQIQASSIAVEALSNMLVQTLLYPQPGNTTNSRYLVKHRSRKDNNLFLESINGRLASISKAWLESDDEPACVYVKNLDYCHTEDELYSLGQTSVYYLWSITGLLEPNDRPSRQMKSTVSNYLIQMSTELDTASSLKALFENFTHWCSNGLEKLPVSLLAAILKSVSILSDLFDDVTFYYFIFAKLRALFTTKYLADHMSMGYLVYMLLKCAAVVEWKGILDSSSYLNNETDVAKFLELVVESGLQPSQPTFVRYCTLHGILHILQSLALENLVNMIIGVTDFVMSEIGRIQRPTDIVTDCSPETIKYHKMVWAVGFRVVEEALPIDSLHKANFIRIVCDLFIDPRLATWQKQLLSRGIESLVIHSCSYSPKFRQIALECFDTFQLRPLHLPFALSVYITCVYRELQEGGEYAYLVNKSFSQDFQKLLNILSFYSISSKCADIVPVLADLICLVWVKETVLENIWNLITPIAAHFTPVVKQDSSSKIFESIDSLSDQQDAQPMDKIVLPQISNFDRALLLLLHKFLLKLAMEQPKNCLEMCWNSLLPKLSQVQDTTFAQMLMLLIMCSVANDPFVYNRVHLLLPNNHHSETDSPPLNSFSIFLLNSFVSMAQSMNFNWTSEVILNIFSKVVAKDGKTKQDNGRISIFKI